MRLPHRCRVARGLLLALALAGSVSAAPPRAKLELFVHDAEASARFYETLGFSVVRVKASDGYTTLRNGELVLALSPLPRWLPVHWLGFLRLPPFGTEIVLYPDSMEAARRALRDAGYAPGEIRRQSWGDRDFRIRDPDGYYVRVSEGAPAPEAAALPDR